MHRKIWASAWLVVVLVAVPGCSGDRALSQTQFCELVRDAVEDEYQGILISRVDERGFDWVRGNGDRGRMVITQEYLYYTQHPEALDELVSRLVSLIESNERLQQLQQDPERIQRLILPVVKPPSFLAEAQARANGQPLLYGQHVATGLLVFYVLDQPTSVSYLTTDALTSLGLTPDEVARQGQNNLDLRTGDDRFLIERTDDGPIAIGDTRDGYDATRLISSVLLLSLSRLLDSSSVVVAIPRRDMILAVPANSPELRQRIAERAAREYLAGPHAITTQLFLVDREGARRLPAEQ